jgi:hypothetical protein
VLLRARWELSQEQPVDNDARQVELGRGVAAALHELRVEDAGLVLPRLVALAVAHADLGAAGALEVVRTALLVRRDTQAALDQEVARLRTELPDRLTLRYVGPQPPYAFLDAEHDQEVPAWA